MRSRGKIAALLACGVLGVGAVAAGCGSSDDSDSTASAESTTESTTTAEASASAGGSAESTDTIDIADFKYDPDAVEVETGTEVTWTNSDDAAHTATADDSSFDTGDLDKGDSKSVTFEEAGSFSYYCRFHPFMKATVEVK